MRLCALLFSSKGQSIACVSPSRSCAHPPPPPRRALSLLLYMAIGGTALAGLCSLFFQTGALRPGIYTTLVGIGLFVANAPFGGVFFDRLIAATRTRGTSLFLVYMGDGTLAAGECWPHAAQRRPSSPTRRLDALSVPGLAYVGSVSILLYKALGDADMSYGVFFIAASLLWVQTLAGHAHTCAHMRTHTWEQARGRTRLYPSPSHVLFETRDRRLSWWSPSSKPSPCPAPTPGRQHGRRHNHCRDACGPLLLAHAAAGRIRASAFGGRCGWRTAG